MLIEGVWHENLVRFPVEKRARASYEMMCDMAPDSRMIPHLVEALEVVDFNPDLRDAADRDMAQNLASMVVPESGAIRWQFFTALREEVLAPAIAACIEAKRLADDAYRASRIAIDAQQRQELNSFALGRRANHFLNASARAAMEAHRLCEIARGKCRALTLVEMHEPWVPFNAQEAGDWLVEAANRASGQNHTLGTCRR
ncbi:MAG: hypothetical protein B7W99_01195 [Rhodospirillales bacterium 20-58-10]|nr:MAG: hypothetical protein B7W99_01195 [Rhodospirillales bacterium 20-58-10]